ncbi:hypothetical protein BpHYR1_002818 [Brachionus plicatilis]|uniref:Uncharacterized protein n=1 Tax=Brachionus plicatilis TaxID=10195 RepID=A0A3M7R274_BRAPC|nr:hypothetical protein BpHYR1_002818 [Brachionus plicatilis]
MKMCLLNHPEYFAISLKEVLLRYLEFTIFYVNYGQNQFKHTLTYAFFIRNLTSPYKHKIFNQNLDELYQSCLKVTSLKSSPSPGFTILKTEEES